MKAAGYQKRALDTWFLVGSRNLYTRRQIVDTKSNILVTINSIFISVVLGALYMNLEEDPHLIWGIGPMIITNLLSITFAIFATRPNLRDGKFTPQELEEKNAALITFDDFYQMPEQQYLEAVNQMMEDPDFIYRTIKKDMYRLGVNLSKRYRYIQLSYDIFLIGLTISIILFGACHMLL